MPFRDRGWEDFQRDCAYFPAYTDYVFGVDTRPEVEQEPGLHPQIFSSPPELQPSYGLPLPVQYPAAYDPALDASPSGLYSLPNPQRTSMLRQDSSMESMQRTPCPAPRALPAAGSQERVIRPGELTTDPAYSLVPEQDRIAANMNVVRAWGVLRDDSDAVPVQRMAASGYLKRMTHLAAERRQEWEALQAAHFQAATGAEEQDGLFNGSGKAEVQAMRTDQGHYNDYDAPAHHVGEIMSRMDVAAEHVQTAVAQQHTIALYQLSTYVQSQLPQLWTWVAMNAFLPPPTEPEQIMRYQQAVQYWKDFRQSIPALGLKWLGLVLDGMVALRQHGDDPMTVLRWMPTVESTLNTGGQPSWVEAQVNENQRC